MRSIRSSPKFCRVVNSYYFCDISGTGHRERERVEVFEETGECGRTVDTGEAANRTGIAAETAGDRVSNPALVAGKIRSRNEVPFQHLNALPNNKFVDMTKLKAFADNKLNVAKMTMSLCDRVENTVGNEENAGYHEEKFQSLLL